MPQRKALPEKNVQFYATCIADALDYLHSRKCNIVYRDLKPENVLLDDQGYPMLIDLGLAKLLPEENDYRTYTLCGTPGYVAPEQIEQSVNGYSFGVDHWSLGVLVYEMLAGNHPFDEWDGTDQMALYSSIVDDSYLALPSDCDAIIIGHEARDWVDQLLVKDPNQRLGCRSRSDDTAAASKTELLSHSWLSGMDVAALRRRAVKAPWVPTLLGFQDSTNFEDWDHLDSIVQTHYPKLTAREAKLFAAFDDA